MAAHIQLNYGECYSMSGTIFKDGLTSEGTLSANSNITLGDVSEAGGPNGEAQGSIVFGAGSDLRITTSADSGVIRQQTASKPLYLQPANSNSILITKSGTPANKIAEFTEAGAVDLYYNTEKMFSTTAGGVKVKDTLLIGHGTTIEDFPALNSPVEINTTNVTASNDYEITTVGSTSDWSQIGGPVVAYVGAVFTPGGSHRPKIVTDAGSEVMVSLANGIDGSAAITGEELSVNNRPAITAMAADCRVRKLNSVKLKFASHNNDQVYIQSLDSTGSASRMRFVLSDDMETQLPTLANSINLGTTVGERFEFVASDYPAGRSFSAATIIPIVNGIHTQGCELILAGTSKVTATYFKGQATEAVDLSAGSTLAIGKGGTGATTFSDKAVLITQDTTTSAIQSVTMSTDGQLLIGGSSGPAAALLSGGDNVTVTNSDGGISVSVAAATAAALGVASFSADNFAIDAGAVTIADSGITTNEITDANVTYAKIQNVGANSFVANSTENAAVATSVSPAAARTMLNVADGANVYNGFTIKTQNAGDANVEETGTTIASADTVQIVGSHSGNASGGTTKVTRSANVITISSTDNDTTYSINTDDNQPNSEFNNKGLYITGSNEINISKEMLRHADFTVGNSQGCKIQFSNVLPKNGAPQGSMQFFNSDLENMRLVPSDDNRVSPGVGLLVNGDITAFSTALSSDIKLKENIVTVDSALDKVSNLNGVTFDWKDGRGTSAGVIAQNVEEVMPILVSEKVALGETEEHKVVDYNGLSALFIEAIKELKEQNELMKAEIEELKANK
jgi:hypothetical protein